MASSRKRRRLVRFLTRRAVAGMGDGTTPLDYIVTELSRGGSIAALAREIRAAWGESLSRQFLSHVAHRLEPRASVQIGVAHRAGQFARALRQRAHGASVVRRDPINRDRMERDALLWRIEHAAGAEFAAPDRLDRSHMELDAMMHREGRAGAGRAHLDALRAVQPAARTFTLDDLQARRPA